MNEPVLIERVEGDVMAARHERGLVSDQRLESLMRLSVAPVHAALTGAGRG